jgi:YD repeat-containing protein
MTFESHPASSSGTSYLYDTLNRITRINNADSTYRLHSYGAGTQSITDERGKVTTYAFRSYGDPSQRFVMSVTAPDSSANISLTRNTKDLVTSATQGGFTRTYGYNSNYYLTSVINPETALTTYERDAAGNMTLRRVGPFPTTTYTYDGRNRLATVTYPYSTPAVTNAYTRTDKLLRTTSSAATRQYLYDANENIIGQTLTIDGLIFNMGYTYNSKDQLNLIVYSRSGKSVAYTPDVLGRPTQVQGYASSVTYWPSGQFKEITYLNGTVTSYGQNTRLWPSLFRTKKGTTSYIDTSYLYDGVGNLTQITDSVDNANYGRVLSYDNINRLTGVNGPWGTGTIAYNGIGNITGQSFGTYNLSYTYDTSNRLSKISGSKTATYNYDLYGSMLPSTGNTYAYDGVPNLRCINCSDPLNKIEYTYDGTNQRIAVTRGSIKTYEVYDPRGNLLVEFTPSQGNKLVEYIYLGGKRIAQRVTP